MTTEHYFAGASCIVNSSGDLFMVSSYRPFINKECTIIKRTKAGLIQVYLNSDPKRTVSVPQSNITLKGEE